MGESGSGLVENKGSGRRYRELRKLCAVQIYDDIWVGGNNVEIIEKQLDSFLVKACEILLSGDAE